VDQRSVAGGKGVNVARVLKALGQPVIATGFAGGPTGTRIVDYLTDKAILNDFVRIRDESRTNMSVVDPTNGQQTEINERGPEVDQRELELFRDKLLYLARGAAIVVIAGSLPRGVPTDVYAGLISDLKRLDVMTVLDTDGEPLELGVKAAPDLIFPNLLEAEELIGHEFSGANERARAVAELTERGPREAVITVPDGCVASLDCGGERKLFRAEIEPRASVASVGSGDALLAGYVAARYGERDAEGCLAYAVACGAESTQHLGAGMVDRREVERLVGEVIVSEESLTELADVDVAPR
jgi:1-phosphofructokinase/tagatose 6-phosphate kinase